MLFHIIDLKYLNVLADERTEQQLSWHCHQLKVGTPQA